MENHRIPRIDALHIQITHVDPNIPEHVTPLLDRLTAAIHKNPNRTFCPEISACIRTNNLTILSHIVKETTVDCPDALFYEFIASDMYRSGKGFGIAIRWFGTNHINPANGFDVRTLFNNIPNILYPLYTRNNPKSFPTIFQIKYTDTNIYAYKFILRIIRVLHKSTLPFPKAIFRWFVDELMLAGPTEGLQPLSELNSSTATIADLILKNSEKIIVDIITNPHLIRNEESKYCLLIREHPNFRERINRILRNHGIYEDAETMFCYPEASATIETNTTHPSEIIMGYPEVYVPQKHTIVPTHITSTTHLPLPPPPPPHLPSHLPLPYATPIEAPYAVAEQELQPNEFHVSDPDEPGIRLIRNKEYIEAERIYGGRHKSKSKSKSKNKSRQTIKKKKKTNTSRKTKPHKK